MINPTLENKNDNSKLVHDTKIETSGFRDYDARWRYPDQINLSGMMALGMGLGAQMHLRKIEPTIVVGNDYRFYSANVKKALIAGLMRAGIFVKDIGLALSPMAYFSQFYLAAPAVAMVTASHNPNGWTGVKIGFAPPLTHGYEDMNELRQLVLLAVDHRRCGGGYAFVDGVKQAYIDDLCGDFKMRRKLRVVCATGNGTASVFAPQVLARIGVKVINLHTRLDHNFPHYNPNPEATEMLNDMSTRVLSSYSDFAVGFDGDGDRCGVVDNLGRKIFADKVGLIMARQLSKNHPDATFVADIKSSNLLRSDVILRQNGAQVEYWKTGHSHMKRQIQKLGALFGFEKSGHYFFNGALGRGYDCGLRMAVELCKLLNRHENVSLSNFYDALPRSYATPTLSAFCADESKHRVIERLVAHFQALQANGGCLAGRHIKDVITLSGARVELDNGSWGLVRASSNTPSLVVVCESLQSEAEMRHIFRDMDAIIRGQAVIGAYDHVFG